MRKIMASIVLVSSFLTIGSFTTSCSKVEDIIDNISVPVPFRIPVNFDASVPFATVSTETFVTYPEIPLNIDVNQKIKDQYPQFSIENLKSAKLDSFTVTAAEGNQVTLDAIKDADIYFRVPNMADVKVATVSDNTNATNINFTTTNEELINHLKSTQNSFVLKIRGSRVAAGNLKIKVSTGFKTEVGI